MRHLCQESNNRHQTDGFYAGRQNVQALQKASRKCVAVGFGIASADQIEMLPDLPMA
ncbi:MAG: hypothetical protein ABI618_09590 [Nitrospirota bacterium]